MSKRALPRFVVIEKGPPPMVLHLTMADVLHRMQAGDSFMVATESIKQSWLVRANQVGVPIKTRKEDGKGWRIIRQAVNKL